MQLDIVLKVGDIVKANSRYYKSLGSTVGVVIEVFRFSDFVTILWADGITRFMSVFDLERINESG